MINTFPFSYLPNGVNVEKYHIKRGQQSTERIHNDHRLYRGQESILHPETSPVKQAQNYQN